MHSMKAQVHSSPYHSLKWPTTTLVDTGHKRAGYPDIGEETTELNSGPRMIITAITMSTTFALAVVLATHNDIDTTRAESARIILRFLWLLLGGRLP